MEQAGVDGVVGEENFERRGWQRKPSLAKSKRKEKSQ
jgi:hypothetical protein